MKLGLKVSKKENRVIQILLPKSDFHRRLKVAIYEIDYESQHFDPHNVSKGKFPHT